MPSLSFFQVANKKGPLSRTVNKFSMKRALKIKTIHSQPTSLFWLLVPSRSRYFIGVAFNYYATNTKQKFTSNKIMCKLGSNEKFQWSASRIMRRANRVDLLEGNESTRKQRKLKGVVTPSQGSSIFLFGCDNIFDPRPHTLFICKSSYSLSAQFVSGMC